MDPTWTDNRVISARLTARGLIAILGREKAGDRRLLVLAEELASVLHTMGRSRSQLSPLLRCAWDSATLRMLDRDRLMQASGGHLSLIGHITQRELASGCHRTEAHNGFADRCLWAIAQRVQCLPDGGNVDPQQLSAIAGGLRRAVEWAQGQPEILFHRGQAGAVLELSLRDLEPGPPWPSRRRHRSRRSTSAAPQRHLRRSRLRCTIIRLPHLEAALTLWDYCSYSATSPSVIVSETPLPIASARLFRLRPGGLSRKQISNLFHGHVSSGWMEQRARKARLSPTSYFSLPNGRGRRRPSYGPPSITVSKS